MDILNFAGSLPWRMRGISHRFYNIIRVGHGTRLRAGVILLALAVSALTCIPPTAAFAADEGCDKAGELCPEEIVVYGYPDFEPPPEEAEVKKGDQPIGPSGQTEAEPESKAPAPTTTPPASTPTPAPKPADEAKCQAEAADHKEQCNVRGSLFCSAYGTAAGAMCKVYGNACSVGTATACSALYIEACRVDSQKTHADCIKRLQYRAPDTGP